MLALALVGAGASRCPRPLCVARPFGHDTRLTLTTYGHVIDELDEAPRVAAENAMRAARHTASVPGVSAEAANGDAG